MDETLQKYTVEELIYEYKLISERKRIQQEKINKKDDKIEEEKYQSALDWAEQEEQKELEELKKKQQGQQKQKVDQFEPSPEDQDWMQQQLDKQFEKLKEKFGDDYGEDISFNDNNGDDLDG